MNTLKKPITEWQRKRFEKLNVLNTKVMGQIFEISNPQEFADKRCKELENETMFFTYEILRYYECAKATPSEVYENEYIGVIIYIYSNWKNYK
jgi:hypothetical protein